MKKFVFILLPVLAMFLGCNSSLQNSQPTADTAPLEQGMGRITISQEEGPDRTLLPNVPVFVSYTLS